jgi:riboflavin biosynthesis pyrimidine reductase
LDAPARGAAILPEQLRRIYAGELEFASPVLYANFVQALDGVVAVDGVPSSGSLISGKSVADRFVMGLLRACADAVLIGAGTLRAEPKHRWISRHIFPDAADAFAELRRKLRKSNEPQLVVVSRSGEIDPDIRVIAEGARIATTAKGAARLEDRISHSQLIVSDGETIDVRWLMNELRERGYADILSEGGPHLFGELVDAELVDELFLTLSPVLAGRSDNRQALNLIEGAALLPDRRISGDLVSLRRHESLLFARYRLNSPSR